MKEIKFADREQLNGAQEQAFCVLINMIIPASDDGRLPAATEVGFFEYVRAAGSREWLQTGLDSVLVACRDAYGMEFSDLTPAQQVECIEKLKRKLFRFFGELASLLAQCYYQDDRVMAAIGLDPRAPFPLGYFPIDGDLTLLEPVFERGQVYRDCA